MTSPTVGSLIALNPNILSNCQRVSFCVEGCKFRWLTDSKVFAKAPLRSGYRCRGWVWGD